MGSESRSNISATFLQPFLSYAPAKGMTVTLNAESSYDWKGKDWTVPLNLSVGQIIPISGQLVSFTIGARYYAEKPDTAAEWGLRFVVTFLLPK